MKWAVDPDWPPFSKFSSDGILHGIDAEFVRRIAEHTGLNIVLIRTANWSEVLEKANGGEIDFLSGTAENGERLEGFNFSEAYCSFPMVIVTRMDSPFYTSPAELTGKRIASPRDYVITKQIRTDFPQFKIILTNTQEEALKMVASSKADASVCNLALAAYLVHFHGLANLKITGMTDYEFPLRLAVRKDAPELSSILGKGLASIDKREREAIYARHIHSAIIKARDWGKWRRRTLYTLLFGSVLLATMFFWNCKLKKRN